MLPGTVRAAPTPRALPNCVGQPQIRPTEVVFSCADGAFGVDHLAWMSWGGSRAVGLGYAFANDCTPNVPPALSVATQPW
jgi:hypothetical protein